MKFKKKIAKNVFSSFFHDFSDFFVTGVFFEGVVCSKRVVTYHTHPDARNDIRALPNLKNPTRRNVIIYFLNMKNINFQ